MIADADNGYGGLMNVMRTVEPLRAGGRCGHPAGGPGDAQALRPHGGQGRGSSKEMVAKIRAAVAARKDPDFCILARTDSRAVLGFDEALDRARWPTRRRGRHHILEAPRTVEEMSTVGKTLRVPLLANMVERGKTPLPTTRSCSRSATAWRSTRCPPLHCDESGPGVSGAAGPG